MDVKRFSTTCIAGNVKVVNYELPKITFGKSLVDKSSFVPIADAVSSLTAGNRAHVEDGTNYDFPNGKDNGADISSRIPGRDIAEIYQEAVRSRQKLSEAVSEAQHVESHRKAIEASYENPTASGGPSESSSGGSK